MKAGAAVVQLPVPVLWDPAWWAAKDVESCLGTLREKLYAIDGYWNGMVLQARREGPQPNRLQCVLSHASPLICEKVAQEMYVT